jgi:soluble lytic murein transglycosylase
LAQDAVLPSQPAPGSLEQLAAAFRAKPGPATRAPLEAFLLRHPRDLDGALARLVLYSGDTSPQGRQTLAAAKPLLPLLGDYVDWSSASTALAAKDYPAAAAFAEAALANPLAQSSPVLGRALLVALKAYREMGEGAKMKSLLARHGKALTAAQQVFYAAWAAELNGDAAGARSLFLDTYTKYPRSPESLEAGVKLDLANLPAERIAERGLQLLAENDARNARPLLAQSAPKLSGKLGDLVKVRVGVADYRLRAPAAKATLAAINVQDPDADAERLFFLLLAARRANDIATVDSALEALNSKYPQSTWRMEGLANAASQHWTLGNANRSLPLYQACAEEFAGQPDARQCAWKLALSSHLLRRPDAEQKLLAYLEQDPAGPQASAALYFLGRGAEARKDRAAARAYYDRTVAQFPTHFYTELSRERIRESGLATVQPSPATEGKLARIGWQSPLAEPDFQPSPAAARRIERAQMLARGALYDFAEAELRHESRGTKDAPVLALETAKLAARRGSPEQAVRYIKSVYPAYINLPMSSVTAPLLKLAYPMPHKDDLLTQAYKNELDPYLVAGLIRQESEFAATAVSRANARGLMQIMPGTGRELAQRMRLSNYSLGTLFDPRTNMAMGTYYFKRLADSWGGNIAQALASYNAGRGRVTQWLQKFGGETPEDIAEFIETIPFEETRNYVQAVMRNAATYRRIYGERPAVPVLSSEAAVEDLTPSAPRPAMKRPVVKTPAAKTPAAKKSAAKAPVVKKAAPKKTAAPKKKAPAKKPGTNPAPKPTQKG